MLREALRVVEAARHMKLVQKSDRTVSDVRDPVELALAVDAVRQALEEFDAANSKGRFSSISRPDFATPPQMDDEAFVIAQQEAALANDGVVEPFGEASEEADALEQLEQENEEKQRLEQADVLAAVAASAPRLFPLRSGIRPSDLPEDATDGVFLDDDTVEKLEMGLDLIEDRLGYAVRKSGWSYKLRGLAESAVQAIGSLDLLVDREREDTWIAMPSQAFSDLMKHVTNVSLNHELNVSLPAPTVSVSSGLRAEAREILDLDAISEPADDDYAAFDAAM